MLEIIVIWRLAVHIGNIAARKGLKKLPYQIMAVVFWICGEISGAMLATVFLGGQSSFWVQYLLALAGAVAGAAVAFLVMRLLPGQETDTGPAEALIQAQIPTDKKFGHSVWIPVMAILVAIICLCTAVGGGFFILSARQLSQGIRGSNPIIGTQLGNDGRISEPLREIPSYAERVYFSFDFNVPTETDTAVTFDWYLNGKVLDSFTRDVKRGNVVVALDRDELNITEFSPGQYQVQARMGSFYLTSGQFNVK